MAPMSMAWHNFGVELDTTMCHAGRWSDLFGSRRGLLVEKLTVEARLKFRFLLYRWRCAFSFQHLLIAAHNTRLRNLSLSLSLSLS